VRRYSGGRAGCPDGRRAGVSAPEVIVALLLGLLVVHLGLMTLARLRTVQLRLASRADALVAMRVASHVLRRELRDVVPGVDWVQGGDSLTLRAFRGVALLCPYEGPTDELTVAYRGDRRPDPDKDSLILLDATGSRQVRALVSVSSAVACAATGDSTSLESWRLDLPVQPGILVARLYERGSDHLSGSALRYRRGASGRQPLTPEVWADSTSWTNDAGRLGIEVRHRDPAAGGPWSASLSRSVDP
jgi:hypothetical protein